MTDWRKLLVDEQLWDYRCKAVPVPLVREIVEEVETLRQDLAAARAEVERLRAGGCARNQRTTQWCQEAEDVRKDLAAARALLIAAATFVPVCHEMQARIDTALAAKTEP